MLQEQIKPFFATTENLELVCTIIFFNLFLGTKKITHTTRGCGVKSCAIQQKKQHISPGATGAIFSLEKRAIHRTNHRAP